MFIENEQLNIDGPVVYKACTRRWQRRGQGALPCRSTNFMELLEAAKKMLKAFDDADATGLFSDHGEHDADLTRCPGCVLDVASEDLREAIEAEEKKGA